MAGGYIRGTGVTGVSSDPAELGTPLSQQQNGLGSIQSHEGPQAQSITDPDRLLRRHGRKFTSFSLIGGAIFVAGLALQAALTTGLHISPFMSYIIQAVVSIEASFLLNRALTWRGAKTPFWKACWRFNAQKVITVTVNLILYAGLLKLGINYLIANVLLTAFFTIVNYLAADRFVFIGRHDPATFVAAPANSQDESVGAQPAGASQAQRQASTIPSRTWTQLPTISVVIPCRANENTIRAAVDSILGQDYPMLQEVVLVGSPGDPTWAALEDLQDQRLCIMETETPPGIRDANFKRDLGIRQTSGDLVSLIDSDMIIPPDWMSNAVQLLMDDDVDCVAGIMRSIRDDFWGRFVDRNRLSAKTPRAKSAYRVTADAFGTGGYKPPITADILFTRKMYEDCPIDSTWSHGSLEDYEWFWRVVGRGHQVLVSNRLFGWHHHRAGLENLVAEYRRSARGCAYFIRAHHDSPFAQKRTAQAIVLPAAVFGVLLGIASAVYLGQTALALVSVVTLALASMAFLSIREFVRTRTLESLIYPIPALILGVSYTTNLAAHLIRNAAPAPAATAAAQPLPAASTPGHRKGLGRLLHPLTGILALQAACSLSLVWSNTAFGDEAEYLWLGRLVLAHWLHGTSWPQTYGNVLSGSPVIYPPIGALADAVGGLAGARILSLLFMLGATALLFDVSARLFNRTVAVFAAAFWAISEPVMKLAFATYDPLSVALTALAAWLAVQVAHRKHRGELVLLTAAALALANVTAYPGVVIDPVVIAFAFVVWRSHMGRRAAWQCCAWLVAAWAVIFALAMTAGRSWQGIVDTVLERNFPDKQPMPLIANDVWVYSGFMIVIALVGVVLALGARNQKQRGLIVLLGVAILLVPLVQFKEQTAWSLDKHMAYGIWFASMAAGYAASIALRSVIANYRRVAAAAALTLALAYPGVQAWQSAWFDYHGWANASSFISAVRPILSKAPGQFYMASAIHIAEYYSPLGTQWWRWTSGGVPELTTTGVPQAVWIKDLKSSNYGVIALFYPTSFSAPANISGQLLLVPNESATSKALVNLAGANASQPGLPAMTEALESDPNYQIVAVGPYNSRSSSGIYAIWQKVR